MRTIYMAIICLAIVAFPLYVFYDLNGNSFSISDRQPVLVVTDSMDGDEKGYRIDSFPSDTLVMVQHLPDNEVRYLGVGEVVSYRDGPLLLQHRIIQVNDDSFYVRGDNGHSTDKVLFSDVNGVVVGTNVWLGHIMSWISGNFMLFLAIMFAACAGSLVLAIYRNNPKEAKA